MKSAHSVCTGSALTSTIARAQNRVLRPVHFGAGHRAQLLKALGPLTILLLAGLTMLSCGGGNGGSSSGGGGTPAFAPAVTYSFGGYFTGRVQLADLNGDSKPDMLVANVCTSRENCSVQSDAKVAVLLGKGDGTFQTAVNYDTGIFNTSSINWMVAADVNGDGKPDLVAVGDGIAVLLGNGDGTFQTANVSFPFGVAGLSVAIADVNHDGKPDLLVGTVDGGPNGHGTLSVYLGNGDGTFQAGATYESLGDRVLGVAVGDFNGDGNLDVVVGNGGCGCSVAVFLGKGDGTFQNGVKYNILTSGTPSVAVADLNGDGKLDLVVAHNFEGNGPQQVPPVAVMLGNGDGTFQNEVHYIPSGGPVSVAVADLNGDGKPDVIAAISTPPSVDVFLGNGDGTLQSPLTYPSGGENYATSVAAADINGDGKADLAVAVGCAKSGCANGTVGVLINSSP